jgi:hypothetical protein
MKECGIKSDSFRAKLEALGYASYGAYLASEHWEGFKRRYRESDLPQGCQVCGERRVHLHHTTYATLGAEALADVLPLCEAHHDAVHERLGASGWPATYTDRVIAELRDGSQQAAQRESSWHAFKTTWHDAYSSLDDLAAWLAHTVPIDCTLKNAELLERQLLRLELGCQALAEQAGGPFPLGIVEAGKLLGLSRGRGSDLLKRLETSGVIRRMKGHNRLKKQAREWEYLGPSLATGDLP